MHLCVLFALVVQKQLTTKNSLKKCAKNHKELLPFSAPRRPLSLCGSKSKNHKEIVPLVDLYALPAFVVQKKAQRQPELMPVLTIVKIDIQIIAVNLPAFRADLLAAKSQTKNAVVQLLPCFSETIAFGI